MKTAASYIALPPSLLLGSAVKGLSLLDERARLRYRSIVAARDSKAVRPNLEMYRQMGLEIGQIAEPLIPLGFQRRPGDEHVLEGDKEALRDVAQALNEAGIVWWADCGTCLGAYRYGE